MVEEGMVAMPVESCFSSFLLFLLVLGLGILFLSVLDFGFTVFLVLFGFNLRYGSPFSLFISVSNLGL